MEIGRRHPGEEALAEAVRHFARHAPGAVLLDGRGLLLVLSAAPVTGSFHAAALRTDRGVPAGEVLAAARDLAAVHARDVVVWATDDLDADLRQACEAAGLARRAPLPGMSTAVAPPPVPTHPHLDLHRVTTKDDVDAFADVHRQVTSAEGGALESVDHFTSPGALTDPRVDAYVALVDGDPAACAMALTTGPVGGVYWVATRPEFRRRGFGDLLTRVTTRECFARGAQRVVLRATELGEPVYRRLGFTRFARYRHYVVRPGDR